MARAPRWGIRAIRRTLCRGPGRGVTRCACGSSAWSSSEGPADAEAERAHRLVVGGLAPVGIGVDEGEVLEGVGYQYLHRLTSDEPWLGERPVALLEHGGIPVGHVLVEGEVGLVVRADVDHAPVRRGNA